jgi:hypothetical protein
VDQRRAVHLVPGAHASHEADEVQEVKPGRARLGPRRSECPAWPGGGSQGRVTRGSESRRDASLGPCWGRSREEEPVSEPARLTGGATWIFAGQATAASRHHLWAESVHRQANSLETPVAEKGGHDCAETH